MDHEPADESVEDADKSEQTIEFFENLLKSRNNL